MQKIIIKHMTGSKANQTETFEMPIDAIVFGRLAESCQVKYDPEKDDLVSRTHLKITSREGNQFLVTDLNSSNGTFINGKKITEPITIEAGDKVQLGKDGPQFIFNLDPPPIKKTRQGESISDSNTTRENNNDRETRTQSNQANTKSTSAQSKQGIGHETLERRIIQTETTTRRKMINISAGIFTVIALVVGYFGYQNHVSKQELLGTKEQLETNITVQATQLAAMKASAPMSATEISRQFGPSTVLIETSWKLMHARSGSQVFHTVWCAKKNADGECTEAKPAYEIENGAIKPVLNFDVGIPIGGSGSGSGFVVQDKGFILTNRHVVAGWETRYSLPFPGVIKICKGNNCTLTIIHANDPAVRSMSDWIPTEAFGKNPLEGKIVHGKHDYLEVTFPKTSLRIPSNLVRISDTADVALIKVDVPQSLQATQLDAAIAVSAGDQITVMGYPGISPDVLVKLDSQDFLNKRGEIRTIPEPTVTTGNIGKVFTNSANSPSNTVSQYLSMAGDSYQLTVNATGPGNSGGPVFNSNGSVIGIFTAMKQDQGTMITFAVPIKHGLDIMGIQKTIQ